MVARTISIESIRTVPEVVKAEIDAIVQILITIKVDVAVAMVREIVAAVENLIQIQRCRAVFGALFPKVLIVGQSRYGATWAEWLENGRQVLNFRILLCLEFGQYIEFFLRFIPLLHTRHLRRIWGGQGVVTAIVSRVGSVGYHLQHISAFALSQRRVAIGIFEVRQCSWEVHRASRKVAVAVVGVGIVDHGHDISFRDPPSILWYISGLYLGTLR